MENKIKEFQPIAVALIVTLGIILSSMFIMGGVIKYQKMQNQSITVTGSASEKVTSDLATLNISYKAQAKNLKSGYAQMKASENKLKQYLTQKGIKEEEIKTGQVTNYEVYKHIGNYTTNEIDFYKFNSYLDVTSSDINLISKISKNIDDMVNLGVEINYTGVQYFISNLDEIKIKMVGLATKDAKKRAQSMVNSTGDKIGPLSSAKMGVFQITPSNSTEVSDYGINDTTSIEKKITAVVNATFTVK